MDTNMDSNTSISTFDDIDVDDIDVDDVEFDEEGYILDNDINNIGNNIDDYCYENFDGCLIDDFKERDIDDLTKTLYDMTQSLQIFIKTPTNEIYEMKEQFSSMCKVKKEIIDSMFLLQKLVKEINDTMIECETILIKEQLKQEKASPKNTWWDNAKERFENVDNPKKQKKNDWSYINAKYSHVFT